MEFMTVEELHQSLSPQPNHIQSRIADYKGFIQDKNFKKARKQQLLKLISDFQEQFRSSFPTSPLSTTQQIDLEDTD